MLGWIGEKIPVGTPAFRMLCKAASGSFKAAAKAPISSRRKGWPSVMAVQFGLQHSGCRKECTMCANSCWWCDATGWSGNDCAMWHSMELSRLCARM